MDLTRRPCTPYDLPVPARASSLIPTDGILLKRLLLVEEADLAEPGDEAYTYSPSTYCASLMNVVRFSRRV